MATWRTIDGSVVTACFISISLALGCKGSEEKPEAAAKLVLTARHPECLFSDSLPITLVDSATLDSTMITQIDLAGPFDKVPEYHDCQRLVTNNQFGPLVGIWADQSLTTISTRIDDRQAQSGRDQALAAAVVLNYDKTTYTPLGIESGFSCLYLWKESEGGFKRWRAKMVPVGINQEDCTKPQDFPQLPGRVLEVRMMQLGGGLGKDDIPGVARWDWDAAHLEHYVGIGCGDGWCEVGDSGFVPSATPSAVTPLPSKPPTPHPTPNEALRVHRVKGWHDRQNLALPGTNTPQLSGIWATAYPHPALHRINDLGQFKPPWIPTAIIEADTDYNGKIHFTKGRNEVSLCNGTADECKIPSNQVPTCTADTQNPADPWWSLIKNSHGNEYRCALRMDHGALTIPGTARWRWNEKDEKLWVRCAAGCCTVS